MNTSAPNAATVAPGSSLAMFRLDGRVAVVTGASSGIGAHCARVLADAGAAVVLVARRRDRLDALAAELHSTEVEIVDVDLAEDGAARIVVDRTMARFGRLDILVNGAGITSTVPATKETTEVFTQVLNVNLIAPFTLAREAIGAMRQNGGGCVVNISSVLTAISEPSIPEAAYTASKGGLSALTRELAVQWARHGVRVNALAPGWFPTEMTAGLADDPERSKEFSARRTPMQRLGRLEELGGPLLLLCSDAGSYITGETLLVDGGASLI